MSSLNPQLIAQVRFLQRQAASLLLYQSVFTEAMGQAFLNLLEALENDSNPLDCLKAYGILFKEQALDQQCWQDYLIVQIIRADNPFSQQAQQKDFKQLSSSLIAAAKSDLQRLQTLYQCSGETLSQWIQQLIPSSEPPVVWQASPEGVENIAELPLKTLLEKPENWADALEELADHYRQFGVGLFATSQAFRWQNGELISISHPDPVHLSQLVSYDSQRQILLQNTEFLLAGYAAQNVLLYGSRGSGKSSLVKALLHQYSDRGLRLIEVAKSELKDLPLVIEQLRGTPHKFIIFVDDLSFEEDDDTFKALKVVLEGNITARPQNVVVYATSNRRHLVREYFADRPQPREVDEVQAWDTVQEKLSFSDRFGLTLTFEPPDQQTYLKMVHHLAALADISLNPEELEFRALQWATRHNGRSGRSARQFIDFLTAELALFSGNREQGMGE
ncbi:ATP-binding protein [Limnoraphis robusta]|uniref:ATPase (AAA+ superfamily) n=1 Tax=Limnoraphis robusta CS-951 TaxID=1637645 RepID=A0A0F5YMM6_9CYAN|nr:ATP-binding protein [Limnoraphis robusta]KKD39917.1 ATPase (AAA+ superfamily) [Limnoraphis robusta CS-951]